MKSIRSLFGIAASLLLAAAAAAQPARWRLARIRREAPVGFGPQTRKLQ